jgi:prophage regulatory protein
MVAVMHHLVGSAEIADMLGGRSRQRVQQIIGRRDFPKPVVKLKMGKVWRRSDVERWMQDHGRADTSEQS